MAWRAHEHHRRTADRGEAPRGRSAGAQAGRRGHQPEYRPQQTQQRVLAHGFPPVRSKGCESITQASCLSGGNGSLPPGAGRDTRRPREEKGQPGPGRIIGTSYKGGRNVLQRGVIRQHSLMFPGPRKTPCATLPAVRFVTLVHDNREGAARRVVAVEPGGQSWQADETISSGPVG